MEPLSRRIFLKAGGATAVTPAAWAASPAQPAAPAASAGAAAAGRPQPYLFFSAEEAAFMEAAVDRLIPPDELGPGAREAGVVDFIDRQLAGAWGAGERLYRSGPWQAGTPSQGYQLPFTPAELFRNALRALAQQGRQGTPFEKMQGAQQDEWLTRLQNGSDSLEGVPARTFFESLLAMTVEGYFSDPAYGGNRDARGWAMIGFPGAYGNYYDLVDRHGLSFDVPPRSFAHDGGGHVHEAGHGAAPKGRR
jgi:gluconate 2-dehydrogenase gamma chain